MAPRWRCGLLIKNLIAHYNCQFVSAFVIVLNRNPLEAHKKGPDHTYYLVKKLLFVLFTFSWSSYPYLYIGKTCNLNPASTYPICYALHILNELLKLTECVVLALDLQRSKWTAVA